MSKDFEKHTKGECYPAKKCVSIKGLSVDTCLPGYDDTMDSFDTLCKTRDIPVNFGGSEKKLRARARSLAGQIQKDASTRSLAHVDISFHGDESNLWFYKGHDAFFEEIEKAFKNLPINQRPTVSFAHDYIHIEYPASDIDVPAKPIELLEQLRKEGKIKSWKVDCANPRNKD